MLIPCAALKWTFIIAVPLGGACLLAAYLINNVSLKKAEPTDDAPSKALSKAASTTSADETKHEKEVALNTV